MMKALLFTALLFASTSAHAQTMTFNGVPTGVGEVIAGGYSENGITATNTSNYFWSWPEVGNLHLDTGQQNGSYNFSYTGGLFNLESFSLTENGGSGAFSLIGYDVGNNAIFTQNSTASAGAVFAFGSTFEGISRLELTATDNHFSIGNINLSAISAVPEPGTWAMMLIGFGGMGVALRRRPQRATLAQLA